MNSVNPDKDRGISGDIVFLLFVIAIGALIRLDLLVSSHFVIDGDEAIVGLMAKHIREGRGIPVFYYGQNYMGSLEALFAAASFALFGASNWALKLVPFLFSLLLIPLLYQVVFEVASRRAARIATLLLAIPPAALVEWSGKARGGFIEVVFLGTLALLFAFRFLREDSPSRNNLFGLSFVLGVGWWVNNQIVYFILPIGLVVLSRLIYLRGISLREKVSDCLFGAASFFLGGAPYWFYNISHHFVSFEILTGAPPGQLGEHLEGLFQQAIPILLGSQRFWHDEELFPHSVCFAYLIFGALLTIFIAKRWRELFKLFILRFDKQNPWEIFLLFILGGLLIFTLSSYGYLVQAPRYLLPLYVGLFALSGIILSLLNRALCAVFLTAILGLNLMSSYLGGLAIPGEPHIFNGERVSKDHSEVIEWLLSQKIDLIRTNYWIGYRLAFETGERVRFKIFQEPYQERIPEYEIIAESRNQLELPIVAVPSQAVYIRQGLQTLSISYKEIQKSGYLIFYDLHSPLNSSRAAENLHQLPPSDFELSSSLHPEKLQEAIDGDIESRWGSGKPQAPGMRVEISFKKPESIKVLKVELGKFFTDFPRAVEVRTRDVDGVEKVVFTNEQSKALKYFLDGCEDLTVAIPDGKYTQITLTETGSDPIFDWSIAELKLFKP